MENKEEKLCKVESAAPRRNFSPVGALPKLRKKRKNEFLGVAVPHGDPFKKVKPEWKCFDAARSSE